MNKNLFLLLTILLFITCMAFMFGCGSNATGGGGGGGGIAAGDVYVGNYFDRTITYINSSTNTVSGSIELGNYIPYNIAASHDGKKIYCSVNSSEVLVIDTTTNSISGHISTTSVGTWDSKSYGMAVSSDDSYLYMTRFFSAGPGSKGDLIKISLTAPYTCSVVTSEFPDTPMTIALNSGSTRAFVATSNNTSPSYLTIVDLLTNTAESVALPYDMASGLAVRGGRIYAPILNNKKCVILNESTCTIETVITCEGSSLGGITDIPGKNKLYVFNTGTTGEVFIIDPSVPTFESAAILLSLDYSGFRRIASLSSGNYAYILGGVGSSGPGSIGQPVVISGAVINPMGSNGLVVAVVDCTSDSIVKYLLVGSGSSAGYNNIVVLD